MTLDLQLRFANIMDNAQALSSTAQRNGASWDAGLFVMLAGPVVLERDDGSHGRAREALDAMLSTASTLDPERVKALRELLAPGREGCQ